MTEKDRYAFAFSPRKLSTYPLTTGSKSGWLRRRAQERSSFPACRAAAEIAAATVDKIVLGLHRVKSKRGISMVKRMCDDDIHCWHEPPYTEEESLEIYAAAS
jgi:hypothetical protein